MWTKGGLTVRQDLLHVIIAFIASLAVALIIGRPFLYALRRLRLRQNIRQEGPQSHQTKAGTPTMGGVIIITAIGVTLAAMGTMRGKLAWAYFLTLGFAVLGLLDDLLGITRGRNMGLKAHQKLLGQIILAGLAALYAVQTGLGDSLFIPFTAAKLHLGAVTLFILSSFAIVATSNGVNLADGLDGLASGTVAVAALTQACLAFFFGDLPLALFSAAVAGACLGFLWFNTHPASIFMGDTGSLALGAALGIAAVMSRTTFLLPITAGVFLLEDLSVTLQVVSFKTTGKRIFRMSPLHHHFELSGWAEEKVVVRFWMAGLIFGLLALVGSVASLRG